MIGSCKDTCTLHIFTLYTLHCTLYTAHFTRDTPDSTLDMPHSGLHFALCTLHFRGYMRSHFTLDTPQSTLYTPHSSQYTHALDLTLCILHLYTLHSTFTCMYINTFSALHTTLHTPQSPIHTVRTTFPPQDSTVFTPHTLHSAPFQSLHWYGKRYEGKNVQNCSS